MFVLGLLVLMLFEAEGPVWAIAKLSFKEAVRSQLLWVFLLVFLPFLFPTQWFRQIKPADELRTTVGGIYLFLTFLVLFPAVLLASFGIPNDIKNLNMPGMTMVFRVQEPALLEPLRAGDKVRFRAEQIRGAYVVTRIERVN